MIEELEVITKKENIFKEIYSQGKTVMKSNVGAAVVAISAAYLATEIAENYFGIQAKEALIGIGTTVDLLTYWAGFIGMSTYLDKEAYVTKGKANWKAIWKKAGETNAIFWIVKGTYAPLRALGHNWLIEKGMEAESGGLVTQVALTGVYTVGLPPAIYAYEKGIVQIGKIKKYMSKQKTT